MNSNAVSIPFFPLPVSLLPGEETALHIFEPRYRLLISECLERHTLFGIPYVRKGKIMPWGTQVRVSRLGKMYSDGRMDIFVHGVAVFRVECVMASETPDVYGTGMVLFPANDEVPAAHDVFDKFFSHSFELTGKVLDPDAWQGAGVFRLAAGLPLSQEQKYRLVSAESPAIRDVRFSRLIDLLLSLYRQESRIKGSFYPN